MAPLTARPDPRRRAFCALAITLLPAVAQAQTAILRGGREREVLALFAPYTLGAEVADGVKLWNVRVEPERIVVELAGATPASFSLEHPSRASGKERSKSFVVRRDASANAGAARDAVDRLVARVQANDTTDFWDTQQRESGAGPIPSGPSARFRGAVGSALITGLFALFALGLAKVRLRRKAPNRR
ncbi:MAG: hypothetical protein R3B13_17335 [Polyangiaceae bacterium]